MFGAYCVQNKTKIEAEHPRATYQMCRLDDLGLACPEWAQGAGPCAGTGLWCGVGCSERAVLLNAESREGDPQPVLLPRPRAARGSCPAYSISSRKIDKVLAFS